jgi:hypothetical protein
MKNSSIARRRSGEARSQILIEKQLSVAPSGDGRVPEQLQRHHAIAARGVLGFRTWDERALAVLRLDRG